MTEKKKTARERKSIKQEAMERLHKAIRESKNRKSRKEARNRLKRYKQGGR